MTVGDPVPKTFATWEKHKGAEDEKYREWERLYREVNRTSTVSHTLQLPGDSPGVVPAGATILRVRRIAGYGTETVLRDAAFLAADYGGDPLKWEKKGGIIETESYRYDVHWYELDGVHYKEKVKGVKQK